MEVRFESDGSVTGSGFTAIWSFEDDDSGGGRRFLEDLPLQLHTLVVEPAGPGWLAGPAVERRVLQMEDEGSAPGPRPGAGAGATSNPEAAPSPGPAGPSPAGPAGPAGGAAPGSGPDPAPAPPVVEVVDPADIIETANLNGFTVSTLYK